MMITQQKSKALVKLLAIIDTRDLKAVGFEDIEIECLQDLHQQITQQTCEICHGSQVIDDAEPAGIFYNELPCPNCTTEAA